jgi:hypothetical protein
MEGVSSGILHARMEPSRRTRDIINAKIKRFLLDMAASLCFAPIFKEKSPTETRFPLKRFDQLFFIVSLVTAGYPG